MRNLIVSARFLDDRGERGLPCGTDAPNSPKRGGKACVLVSDEEGADIIDDAAYQGWFTDAAPAGLVRAARTAFRDCLRHGFTYSKGVRLENDLAVPGDA